MLPQEIPAGFETTTPAPVPAGEIHNVTGGAAARRAKFAVQLTLEVITPAKVGEVPLHTPDHPVNTDPLAGFAMSEMYVLTLNRAAHTLPQEIPAGCDSTNPPPAPVLPTESFGFALLKVAAPDSAINSGASANISEAARAIRTVN